MFEAKLKEGGLFKKLIESIKELVNDINLDNNSNGISLQAMDSSHVALVTLNLMAEGFDHYRCDRPMTLGISVSNLSKIMKCGGNDDSITLKAEEEPSSLNIIFENKKQKKTSDFTLNLITIDSEHLGIPDTSYSSIITMPSGEFTRICRELFQLSETVVVETNKFYVKFSVIGDVVGGSIKIDGNETSEKENSTSINVSNNNLTIKKVEEPVNLAFALRYLNMFTKASSLSEQV